MGGALAPNRPEKRSVQGCSRDAPYARGSRFGLRPTHSDDAKRKKTSCFCVLFEKVALRFHSFQNKQALLMGRLLVLKGDSFYVVMGIMLSYESR